MKEEVKQSVLVKLETALGRGQEEQGAYAKHFDTLKTQGSLPKSDFP